MGYRTKGIGVAIATICVVVLLFVVRFVNGNNKLDIHKLDPRTVDSIKIYDRGLVNNDSLVFTERKEVEDITSSLLESTIVNYNSINFKDSNGLCEVELYLKNNEAFKIIVQNNIRSGGIVRSGKYCYRNDKLLSTIIESLKKK